MKYLKLFEAFTQNDKVEKINNLFVEWRLFTSFIKWAILVERNYRYSIPTWTFWEGNNWARFGILDYTDRGQKYIIEPTAYTEGYLERYCGFNKKQAEEISRNINQFGVYQAAKKYIEYLKNAPDKKHLLKE